MSLEHSFQLTDDIRLSADRFQYIIMTRRIIEDEESPNFGKEDWVNDAYLPRLTDVIRYLVEKGLKDNIGELYKVEENIKMLESKVSVFEQVKKHREGYK